MDIARNDLDRKQASRIITDLSAILKENGVLDVANLLYQHSAVTGIDGDKYYQVMRAAADQANQLGVKAENYFAATGAMLNRGVGVNESAESMKAFLTGLLNVRGDKKKLEELNSMGIVPFDDQGKMLPLDEIIKQFRRPMMSERHRLEKIFGPDFKKHSSSIGAMIKRNDFIYSIENIKHNVGKSSTLGYQAYLRLVLAGNNLNPTGVQLRDELRKQYGPLFKDNPFPTEAWIGAANSTIPIVAKKVAPRLLKIAPYVGAALSIMSMDKKWREGDYVGATLEGISAIGSFSPDLRGILIAAGAQTILVARDITALKKQVEKAKKLKEIQKEELPEDLINKIKDELQKQEANAIVKEPTVSLNDTPPKQMWISNPGTNQKNLFRIPGHYKNGVWIPGHVIDLQNKKNKNKLEKTLNSAAGSIFYRNNMVTKAADRVSASYYGIAPAVNSPANLAQPLEKTTRKKWPLP